MNASRFLFDHDFRAPPKVDDTRHLAALQEAQEQGRARGIVEGRHQAQAGIDARLAEAMGRLADAATALLAETDAQRAALEQESVDLALAFARKLAGEALAAFPLAAIAEVARGAFPHLRGVPHLAVRVNDGLVEKVDPLMQKIARERGYEGRIVVLGEPEIAPGDVRLEWADGAVVRDAARIDDAVAHGS